MKLRKNLYQNILKLVRKFYSVWLSLKYFTKYIKACKIANLTKILISKFSDKIKATLDLKLILSELIVIYFDYLNAYELS